MNDNQVKEYSDKMSKILDEFNLKLTDNKVEYTSHNHEKELYIHLTAEYFKFNEQGLKELEDFIKKHTTTIEIRDKMTQAIEKSKENGHWINLDKKPSVKRSIQLQRSIQLSIFVVGKCVPYTEEALSALERFLNDDLVIMIDMGDKMIDIMDSFNQKHKNITYIPLADKLYVYDDKKHFKYFNFNEEGKGQLKKFIQEKSQNRIFKLILCSQNKQNTKVH